MTTRYDLEILIRTKQTGDGVEQLNRGLDQVGRNLSQTGQTAQGSGLQFTELASKLSVAKVAFGTVAEVAKFAYDQIEEGAALQAAEAKFGNLAESIGTTADALEGELTAATRGMVANSELIASATDIISLGLADNEEGVTRMATVISGLGLDMQQVILTFANNSKARLDALGLSVEDVTAKAAELEAQGFVGDAFDEAVLIGLEEKMDLFGDQAETTAGQLAILKAEAQNAKDAVAVFFSTITAPVIENLAKSTGTYQQQLHATALELASTAKNSEDLRRVINDQFGAGEDLFRQAEEMGLAFVDLGHGQSIWIEDLEKAAGISIPRYGQELEKLNQLSREYTVVTGTGAVGAASDYGTELARLSQMGQEAAAANRGLAAAEREATAAMNHDLVAGIRAVGDPIDELLEAQADLTAASGEWVTTYVDNTGRISTVSEQLALDLSNEQRDAFEEILDTVDEGSAEWLNAYNALQNDLTESQRQALIAQRADLEAANGEMGSAYTGNAAAAEDAQERIKAANEALIGSYRDLAFEGSLALAELSGDPAAIQRALDYAVAIGEISQEAADMRLQAAQTRIAIEELNQQVVDGSVTTEEAKLAFDILTSGMANTSGEAVTLASRLVEVSEKAYGIPAERVIELKANGVEAVLRGLGQIKADLESIPTHRSVNVSVNTTNNSTAQDLNQGGTVKEDGKRAGGGDVYQGKVYRAGEGNLPEILATASGTYLIPGDRGRVISHQQAFGSQAPNITITVQVTAASDDAAAYGNAAADGVVVGLQRAGVTP